jgi:eukaryotic-like serine/threonine-protein kinase
MDPLESTMALSAGTRLGPYEILGPIGAGGMGEVYRARDTRLGREVAVKVLPGGVSHDAERLHRFEQEARLAGSLNHPNVLTLFDVGSHDGAPYLVTELLEGRSLREVLAAGPMPPRKATEYAQQVAHGLAAAHEHGVVHRDLKPGNLFVTKDGRVKILDFGLAKLTQADPQDVAASQLSTDTAEGKVVGTIGYMSPEQVRGHAVDARSDIFALGAVVYEMLSGRRAFSGDTPADTMTSILTRDPEELSRPGLAVPANLERIVRRCLEKDPEERFQSAKDVAFALEAESGTSRPGLEAVAAAPRHRRWVLASVVGLALLTVGVGIGLLSGRKLWERPLPKITQLTFRRGVVDCARFTADGQTVVYSAFWDGNPPEIFTTRVEGPESRSLGLPPARLMSVSSTGELAILLMAPGDLSDLTTGTLARVPLSGGEPRRVLDDVVEADWSPDGRELAVIRRVGPVGGFYGGEFQLEYPIGNVLARPVRGQLRVSPRGDRVAVSDGSGIAVYDRAGRKTPVLTPPVAMGLIWAADDGLWFAGGEKWRARSVWRASPSGRPREVYRGTGNFGVEDTSSDGRVLLAQGIERVGVRVKAPGEKGERELGVFSWTWAMDLSADGSQTLLCEGDSPGRAGAVTYVAPTRSGPPVRLGEGTPLAFSPKGTWALVATPDRPPRFIVTPTGPGESRTLPSDRFESIENAWFLDEALLLIQAAGGGRRPRSFLVDLSGAEPRPVTPEGINSIRGAFGDGTVLGADADGALARYPLQGGDPQPIAARLPPGSIPLRVSGDGRFVFVGRIGMPYRVERLELTTGCVTPWKALRPDDLTGATHIIALALSADGEAYAYTYGRYFHDLYLVEGLRP